MPEYDVILFDGTCGFCSAGMNFIIDHDKAGRFRFAASGSQAGGELLVRHGISKPGDTGGPGSVVLIQGNRAHLHSTAVLRIAKGMGGVWSLFYAFSIIPAFVRDPVYKWVARNRRRWSKPLETCPLPTPERRARFLDAG